VTDLAESTAKPLKDGLDVSALLHGDDSHLILLVQPDEKRLVVVVPTHVIHTR